MLPLRDTLPSHRFPLATVLLIVVNIAAFFRELTLPPEDLEAFIWQFGFVPANLSAVRSGEFDRVPSVAASLFTSMFLHGGWLHLIGNMWTLWIFGDNVEDRMGKIRFVFFYLICGVAAGGLHAGLYPHSEVPTIGASGAIAGVLGGYFLMFPRSRVLTLVPVFIFPLFLELPAVIFLGIWFATQLLAGHMAHQSGAEAGGIAWWAHVGGFIAGMILCKWFARRRSGHWTR